MVQDPLSGLSVATPDNLVLDAGVVYANIDLTDLEATGWTAAVGSPAELLGATRGDAVFNANRELRQVDVNGTLGPVKGMRWRTNVAPTLRVTLLEISSENIQRMIPGAEVSTGAVFDRITGAEIEDGDYIGNIALAATIKGSDEPVVIVLFNVLAQVSPDFTFADRNELGVEVEFAAHFPLTDPRDELGCWRVYRPIPGS